MKQYLTLAAAFLAVSSAAFAEDPASASASAMGVIEVPLTIEVQRNLTLPTVERGTVSSIDPINDLSETNSALFRVLGDEGDAVLFTLPPAIVLNWDPNSNGAASEDVVSQQNSQLNFTLQVGIKHFQKELGPPTALDLASHNPWPLSTNPQDGGQLGDGQGQMYVYVGGTTGMVPMNQNRGTYNGTVPLTVSYQ
jgi:hypothetical protein